MNSEERHEARYQRRKARRHKYGQNVTLEKVYTIQNLQKATNTCRKGVMWKESPIRYTTHAVVSNKQLKDRILAGQLPQSHGVHTAVICERGKQRDLHMVTFADRVPQKCICTNALIPGILPSVIYDNAASQKDRGTSFTRQRVVRHIQRAVHRYGIDNTYVLILDLRKFFKSIPHRLCVKTLNKAFSDRRITDLTMHYIKLYHQPDIDRIRDPTEREAHRRRMKENLCSGCTLGSEISQEMAIAAPGALDHLANALCPMYARYMDDMIFFGTMEALKKICTVMKEAAASIGLTVNAAKIRLQKVTAPFTFLKIRYRVTETGKILRQITRSGIVRQRQKLKRFRHLVDRGKMSRDDVAQSMQSWLAHLRGLKAWHAEKNMIRRYKELFSMC